MSAVSGDFDRDGRPDLAVVENFDTLTVYRNLGAGKFSKVFSHAIATNQNPVKLEAADVNGDGKLDLVIGVQFVPEIEVWTGNGNGTFTFFRDEPAASSDAFDFDLADVNNDHHVDFLNRLDNDSGSGVVVLLNDGAGNFTFHGTVPGAHPVDNWAVADFDGDGRKDVLLRMNAQLQEFRGDGAGNFALHVTSSVQGGTGDLVVGSFNHDSKLDIALHLCTTANCITPNKLYTYLNDGTGHFGLRSTTSVGSQRGVVASGDLNGDTVQDVAMTNVDPVNGFTAHQFPYVLNTGDGHFSAAVNLGNFAAQNNVFIRDMNLDGRHDLVLTASPGTIIFSNTNAPVICAPPGSATLNAKFCGLASGATVAKTFTVKASGNSPAGVARLELWLDGRKQFELWNDQLQRSLTVAAGQHRVSVVAVDRFGATATRAITVTAH